MINRARKNLNDRKGDEGFTLIELLIVIVVLGILAGIVVFGLSTFRDDSNTAACKADVKTVGVAADAYEAKTGTYPTAIGQLLPQAGPPEVAGYLKAAPATAITFGNKQVSASCGGTNIVA